MNAKQALDYLYQATVIEPTVADDKAEVAIAAIRVYIDELELLLNLKGAGQAAPPHRNYPEEV